MVTARAWSTRVNVKSFPQDMHAARPASSHHGGLNSLEVWVILVELVEMVSIPVGKHKNNGEMGNIQSLQKEHNNLTF